jgi:hypothetical protein
MKVFSVFVLLAVSSSVGLQFASVRSERTEQSAATMAGRWRVKVSLSSGEEKNLIFETKADGTGSLLGLDTESGAKPMDHPAPALWSRLADQRISFSANLQLQLGSCCREAGTLILRSTIASEQVVKGKAIFIASSLDEENFIGFRSEVGAFNATRESLQAAH